MLSLNGSSVLNYLLFFESGFYGQIVIGTNNQGKGVETNSVSNSEVPQKQKN